MDYTSKSRLDSLENGDAASGLPLMKEQLVNLGLGFSGAHLPSHTVFSISTLVGLKRESWETQHEGNQ